MIQQKKTEQLIKSNVKTNKANVKSLGKDDINKVDCRFMMIFGRLH